MMTAIAFILKNRHLIAYGSIAVIIAGLLVIHKLDKATIATCKAERLAIEQMTEQLKSSAEQAAKRLADESKRRTRIIDRNLRDINNAPETDNAALAPILADAIAGLCNAGASGCAAK